MTTPDAPANKTSETAAAGDASFARWVFQIAGGWGLAVVTPMLFTERRFVTDSPPAVTHPEFYYGFAAVVLAWQVLFLVLSADPVQYRPMMLAAVLEKVGFVVAAPILYAQGRTPGVILVGAAADAVLGVLFVAAYARTPKAYPTAS